MTKAADECAYFLEKQDRRTTLKLISHRHVLSCQPQKQSYNLLEFCISLPPKPIIFDFKIFHVGMQNLYNYNSGNSKMVKNSICANLFYFFSLIIIKLTFKTKLFVFYKAWAPEIQKLAKISVVDGYGVSNFAHKILQSKRIA